MCDTEDMKQIVTSGRFVSPAEHLFLEEYCENGGNVAIASKASGVAPNDARLLLNSIEGMRYLRNTLNRLMLVKLAPAALGVLQRYLDPATDIKKLSKVQLETAKTVLDRAGLVVPRAPELRTDEKALEELSSAELNSFIEDARRQIAKRDAQDAPVIDHQDSNMFS
jgi:hypothetical protein